MSTLNRSSIIAYSASVRVVFRGDRGETRRLAIRGRRWSEVTSAFFHHLTATTVIGHEPTLPNTQQDNFTDATGVIPSWSCWRSLWITGLSCRQVSPNLSQKLGADNGLSNLGHD